MEYGDQFYEAPTDYCKGQKYCGNNHIDARFHRRVALCATYLVTGKCRWGNNCKYLHISENITPSISTPHRPRQHQTTLDAFITNPLTVQESNVHGPEIQSSDVVGTVSPSMNVPSSTASLSQESLHHESQLRDALINAQLSIDAHTIGIAGAQSLLALQCLKDDSAVIPSQLVDDVARWVAAQQAELRECYKLVSLLEGRQETAEEELRKCDEAITLLEESLEKQEKAQEKAQEKVLEACKQIDIYENVICELEAAGKLCFGGRSIEGSEGDDEVGVQTEGRCESKDKEKDGIQTDGDIDLLDDEDGERLKSDLMNVSEYKKEMGVQTETTCASDNNSDIGIQTDKPINNSDIGIQTDTLTDNSDMGIQTETSTDNSDVGIQTDKSISNLDKAIQTDTPTSNSDVGIQTATSTNNSDVGIQTDGDSASVSLTAEALSAVKNFKLLRMAVAVKQQEVKKEQKKN